MRLISGIYSIRNLTFGLDCWIINKVALSVIYSKAWKYSLECSKFS